MSSKIYTPNKAVLQQIGQGGQGVIYRVARRKAAKILHERESPNEESAIALLEHECQVASFLFEAGFNVPRPFGISRVQLPPMVKSAPALIMGYIPGRAIGFVENPRDKEELELWSRRWTEAVSVYKAAAKAGFYVGNISPFNVVWHENLNKPYLVDFSRWDLPQTTK